MSDLYHRQEKLKLNSDQSITVVGCGGIGFWVCKFAAMSGIEKIYAFDPDIIDISNLNRLDLPERFINRNKAEVAKIVVNTIRPDCSFYAMPYPFSKDHRPGTGWLIDCTDKYKVQLENQEIADTQGMKYMKAGYDGENFSINGRVAEWGDDEDDGYKIVPSWVAPAVIIAAMTIAKIMKYPELEFASNIKGIFKSHRV